MLASSSSAVQTPVSSGKPVTSSFLWTRSETLALAAQKCVHCLGFGMRFQRGDKEQVCYCVCRKIFNICFARFSKCVSHERVSISAAYQDSPAHSRRHKYGFRNEEYMADFLNLARTALSDRPLLYKIFRLHYLYGADFRLVNRKIGRREMDRNTFHDFYRIEHALGRAFRETQPYSLFPLDEYFGGTTRARVIPFPAALQN